MLGRACSAAGAARPRFASRRSAARACSSPQSSTLIFEATPGEQNDVELRISAQTATDVTYSVTDATSPTVPGAGCSGGGAPGGEVLCQLKISRPANCVRTICLDLGRKVFLRIRLGDGDDSLAASALPADDGGHGVFETETQAGEGDDTVLGSTGTDRIDPGPGADRVEAGSGGDSTVAATAAPDGADHLDLGAGGDFISYTAALGGISISLDEIANDGAAGEGDNVLGAEALYGGAGDDSLSGANQPETASAWPESLNGGAGDDVIAGNEGDDFIRGDAGSDRITGGPGDDHIEEYGAQPNRISGGSGQDDLFGGSRGDRIIGGTGADLISGYGGGDALFGGRGPDVLNSGSRDQDRDSLDCGPAKDLARVDPEDLASRCEDLR